MKLYDSASRALKEVAPKGDTVTMYSCGITPYDAAHLGHAAVFLNFDLLSRVLRSDGHKVKWVRNITDVDDSILGKARSLGVHYLDLAASEVARFDRDMGALGLLAPDSEPRATSAIPEILLMIEEILDAGYAYQKGGAVYFDVSKCDDFGSISHMTRDEMLEAARERGGNVDDPNKKDPLDFVLWQPSLSDEPAWDSRFGPGRPGWHIECSALALRELGTSIDIHGGGYDLIFPHHECEAAQSKCATKEDFVDIWMHVGMVYLDGSKMSKSLGNLVFVGDLLKTEDVPVVRAALMANHYRSHWEWNDEILNGARTRVGNWRKSIGSNSDGAIVRSVKDVLTLDLDTPSVLSILDDASSNGFDVTEAAKLVGIDIR
ncbi:MAG: cysteine--tRNA ligase [Actinomycetota bacterium]|nr:cysteine--tRNA ligase [Actinomycetota bacterium]